MATRSKYQSQNVGIDYSEFQRKAKKLAKAYKVDEREFIKDQSRLLAREAAKFTPPFAGGILPSWSKGTSVGTKADIEEGEWAVRIDLGRIFEPWKKQDAFSREYKRSKGGPVYDKYGAIRAPSMMTNGFQMYRWHQEHRKKDGRTRKLKQGQKPIVSEALFEEYVKDMQKHVGVAKAAFLKVSMSFGGKSSATPKIKRHLDKATGSGKLITNKKGTEGLLTAMADGLYHTKRQVPHLMRNRLKKAVKRLQYIGRQSAKNAGFKTR